MNAIAKSRNPTEYSSSPVAKPSFLQLRMDQICTGETLLGNVWQSIAIAQTELVRLPDILSDSLFSEIQILEICSQLVVADTDLKLWVIALSETLPKLTQIDLVIPVSDQAQIIDWIQQIGAIAQRRQISLVLRLVLTDPGSYFIGLHEQNNVNSSTLLLLIDILNFVRNCKFITAYKLEFTIDKNSVFHLQEWFEFASDQQVPIVYQLGVPPQTTPVRKALSLTRLEFEEAYHLSIFLENLLRSAQTSAAQTQFYRSLIAQLIHQKPRSVGCKWQSGGITLCAAGELRYCAIASQPLGLTLEQEPMILYATHQEHWQSILQTECPTCLQDCILPDTTETRSKSSSGILRQSATLLSQLKSLKLLKPLKTLQLQTNFHKHLQTLGVDAATHTLPPVSRHFPAARSDPRQVLICGWYGTETLGDKAILGGVVQALQTAMGEFELHLVAIEVYISQMTIRQMPELHGCVLHSLEEGLELVESMDLVVFGGGPLMAIGAMAEMMAFFQRAVAANIPTLLAGCGVGPLGANFLNQAVRHVLLHSSYRIYRDQKSLENARSLGVDVRQDIVAEDPAFTWLASKTDRWQRIAPPPPSPQPRLILGLRDWPYHEFAAEMGRREAERLKHRFEQEVVTGLEQLVEHHPALEIVAFPMCTNHLGFDDRWFYYRLFRDRPKLKAAVDFSYLGAELSPDDSLAVFQSATAALTMRFHALIFALSNGVPAVAIDYTLGRGKVKSLAEKFCVPYQGLDSISAEFITVSLSQILTGKANHSVMAFQQRTLAFKDSVKTVIKALN